jgi:hypothetical protein
MPTPRTRPQEARVVRTYEEMSRFVGAFARGHLNLLILIGAPGLGKSRTVRQAVGPEACWVEGNATPFGLFGKAYHNRGRLVVIDDVDDLYSEPAAVRLLKCLCQTEREKSLAWHSATTALEREGIPRQFVTTSRVAILCNTWRELNDNVRAIQDRGHVILFEPTPEEVHREVGGWFADAEVYDWFSRHLHLVASLSMRHYVRASELRQAGLDWKEAVPLLPLGSRALLVTRLRADPQFATEEERARAFVKVGGGCRATYFNHARRLKRSLNTGTR